MVSVTSPALVQREHNGFETLVLASDVDGTVACLYGQHSLSEFFEIPDARRYWLEASRKEQPEAVRFYVGTYFWGRKPRRVMSLMHPTLGNLLHHHRKALGLVNNKTTALWVRLLYEDQRKGAETMAVISPALVRKKFRYSVTLSLASDPEAAVVCAEGRYSLSDLFEIPTAKRYWLEASQKEQPEAVRLYVRTHMQTARIEDASYTWGRSTRRDNCDLYTRMEGMLFRNRKALGLVENKTTSLWVRLLYED